MKYLSTNVSGKDVFGGIHTHLREHVNLSPQHDFYILELCESREYPQTSNLHVNRINSSTGFSNIKGMLNGAESIEDLKKRGEGLIQEYQKNIKEINPDVILLLGTSLPSYFLLNAVVREGCLDKILHSYSGVVEMERGGYARKLQGLLDMFGKEFTSEQIRDNVVYIFPSEHCKNVVEKLHRVKLENSYIIPNGVSDEFLNNSLRIPPKELSLGYVGRFSPVKNPDFFMNLKDEINEPVLLKIVTDIVTATNSKGGSSLLQKMNKGEVLYFHPRHAHELSKFYKRELSTTVIPSLFETFCNVATESIISGTPVLLSDRAGVREVFERYGLEDLIFSIDSRESFSSAMDFAKSMDFRINPELSREMYFELSWDKIIEKYNNIAERVREKSLIMV